MTNFGKPCIHDIRIKCFVPVDCESANLVDCLKAHLYLTQKENEKLKATRLERHNKTSIKWRDQSFYYKKRLKLLTKWVQGKGLQPPTVEELFSSLPKEIVKDEPAVCGDSEAKLPNPPSDTGNIGNGESSNPSSGHPV